MLPTSRILAENLWTQGRTQCSIKSPRIKVHENMMIYNNYKSLRYRHFEFLNSKFLSSELNVTPVVALHIKKLRKSYDFHQL